MTDFPDLDLGKIEDAGVLVEGGRIDRHWGETPPDLDKIASYFETDNLKTQKWLYEPKAGIDHFRLRSIEFGNWMNQQDRADFLYASMFSLSHLARVLHLKPEQIGFFGRLSLALGARGKGKAKAHYESTPFSIINLAKTEDKGRTIAKGRGSLAHEFAHGLDNIISFHTSGKQQRYVSGGHTTRKGFDERIFQNGNWFEKRFEVLFNTLYFDDKGNKTDFYEALVKTESDYLQARVEVFARTFEVYIYKKLKKARIDDTFLVKQGDRYKRNPVYPSNALVNQVTPIIDKIVAKAYEIITEKNAPNLKGIQGEVEVTGYDGFRKTLKKNANLDDTLANMKRIALRDAEQVRDLAENLQGATVAETAENIWDFVRANIAYKLDNDGFEELRTPARSWQDRFIGVDCDDYTILISAILLHLGIEHEYRVTAYKTKGKFQHIYPVAFDEFGNEYVIDNVPEIPQFNFEAQPIIDLKTVPMELQELSGVGEVTDEALAIETKQEIVDEITEPFSIPSEDDDDSLLEENFLSGFGEVDTEEEADIVLSGSEVSDFLTRGLLAEINKAKLTLMRERQTPTVLSEVTNVPKELSIIDDVMGAWEDEDDRKEALQDAIKGSQAYSNFYKAIFLAIAKIEQDDEQGVSGFHEEDEIFLARMSRDEFLADDEDEEDSEGSDLGRRRKRKRRLRGFFKKIGKGIKKVIKAVVKFNPLTLALRGATLVILKTNMFKFASKLIYGYLTEDQARAQGLDIGEWRKLVIAVKKAEKFYTKIGGKASAYRKAIVKGRARKKTGLNLSGLGVVATAGAATAGSGFIVFIKKILSKVNPVKLFKNFKAKRALKKAGKALTDGAQTSADDSFPDLDTGDGSVQERKLPGEQGDGTTANDGNGGGGTEAEPKMMAKAMTWVKNIWANHKGKIIGGSIGSFLLVLAWMAWKMWKKKQARSMAGIKGARTRARNRKQLNGTQVKGLKGSTTITKRPTKAKGNVSAKVSTLSNSDRLKQMHRIAKSLKKKHPNAKYSTLLSKAAKKL